MIDRRASFEQEIFDPADIDRTAAAYAQFHETTGAWPIIVYDLVRR